MKDNQSPEQDKKLSEKQKEEWVRAHRLTLIAISIATVGLIIAILSATAGWLKFPKVARAFGLESWLGDSLSTSPPSNQNTDIARSKQTNNENIDPLSIDQIEIQNESVTEDYQSSAYALPIIVRVTWHDNSDTTFEIFNKRRPIRPFQTFSINTPERPEVITVDDIIPNEFSGNFLVFDDLNFDGYVDFLVRDNHSACCYGYKAFIYNPYLGTFAPDQQLNDIFPLFRGYQSFPKKKEIHVFHSCVGNILRIVYQWQEGKIVPTHNYVISIEDGKEVEISDPDDICG
jgi:hypothetical protein